MRTETVFSLSLSLALLSACAQAPDEAPVDQVVAAQGSAPADAYRHPLQHAADSPGARPFVDTHDAPDGRRYLVAEGQSVDEDGTARRMSGVFTADRRPLSASERAELTEAKQRMYGSATPATPKPSETAVIGPDLSELLDHVAAGRVDASDDPPELVITLRRPLEPPLFTRVEQAIARGEVATREDRARVFAAEAQARRERIGKRQAPVIAAVGEAGGTVLDPADNMHFIVARIPFSAVRGLARRPDIARIELHTFEDNEVDGEDIIKGQQIEQFITGGYDGENVGNSWDITFAQVEGGGAYNEHLGFREGTGTTTRIRGMLTCGIGCSTTSGFTTSQESDHASSVAGIIFGDLRDGQDSSYTTSADRIARSGYAGEARGWLYAAAAAVSFNDIAGRTGGTAPAVVNMSAGKADADPQCLGRDSRSVAANEMFEAGKLLIKSAGNEYHSSTTDCTVTSPGSGIGVFSVGSVGSSSSGTETTVRGATITGFSSRGGTGYTEGKYRTIVDIAAYGYRQRLFDKVGGYSRSGGGTSYAAPSVTGTALAFIDHFKHEYSDLIDNPGVLVANLLLMGDRQLDSGSRATSGYDNLYGSGRLRARRFDSAGMDAPWAYSTGYLCIDDGEVHTITINSGNPISTDVEAFKAVLWWYDSRHEVDGTLDDIDLSLKTTAGATLRSSVSLDNKERVFHDGVGGQAIKLEIKGYRVTADDTGCGTNSMKVYYGYFYEDSDRDDADGPNSSIDPE